MRRHNPVQMGFAFMAVVALFSATPSIAQAWQCRAPKYLPRPALELPGPGQIRRTSIGGYTLALSWSREYCRGRDRDPVMRFQCSGEIGDFGFVLHGLWPESNGPNYPQYCRKVGVLRREIISRNICMTPTPQLLQHEWAKHGTCMAKTPDAYFGAARLLFNAVQFPDMDRLSRQVERGTPLTAAGLAQAFADINDGLPAHSVKVITNGKGWLQEVRICLGKDLKPRRCPRYAQGLAEPSAIKVWRGR
ncbi:ribonuclease T2 family protein [Sphingorhabdus profundilacus]|uniref:ribonuclease T2 family protein n=1 Tax=Sphingorhabdus profundilacus TaxID=2509718 RepID=UPI0013662B4F|nr:ribonuclease T2 [Sphingorhabdus profundilacus]